MGAGCSGTKATKALNPSSVDDLTSQAHEHLKDLKKMHPDGRAATPTKDMLDSTMGRGSKAKVGDEGTVDDRCTDLNNPGITRSHEKLWQAVEKEDAAAAEKYLDNIAEQGTNIEESDLMDSAGQSMIHKCASLGYADILMLLLERTGAKPDLVNGQLATPLHLACRNDRESIVKFLIGCGVDCNAQDEHGQTPLLVCCIHGHKNLASFLIESSIAGHLPETLDVDVKDQRGLTPLNCASIKGDIELTKILVSRGGANVNQNSPKGCTPLIYAGRGGYAEVVSFLLEKKASPLKQDNAGGTVLHHAIEKGHINVLEAMLAHGVDVYSSIEIADNAGRTPLFEAVENMEELQEEEDPCRILKMLVAKRAQGGFGAKANVVNFNGQTPLFSAVREGNMAAVKVLVEQGSAKADLTGGELVKIEDQEEADEDEYDCLEEKYFMHAFKNCMTPLHCAAVLGYDEIAHYLVEHGADVNLSTAKRKYTSLHLAVLANKPEMIIELLTKTNADPMCDDGEGQSLLDMVYKYIPSYVESFQVLLENLSLHRLQTASASVDGKNVARHYVDPEDERKIAGVQDAAAIQAMYAEKEKGGLGDEENGELGSQANPFLSAKKQLNDVDESEIKIPEGENVDSRIESVFGRKVGLAMLALNWKYKEMAVKVISKTTEKTLNKTENSINQDLGDLVEGATAAVSLACKEKVIKVLNVSLALFNMMVSSSKIDQDANVMRKFYAIIESENIVQKLLLKSEESNTRITNKVHEALLDLSYHPKIGEDFVAKVLIQQICQHYAQKSSNNKGLLAQLALLFKMINSFGLADVEQGSTGSVMTSEVVIGSAIPAIGHTNKDVKNAAIKILLDVQRISGAVKEEHLQSLNEKTKAMVWDKVCETEVEKPQENSLGRSMKQPQQQPNVVTLEFGLDLKKEEEDKITTEAQVGNNKENFEKLKAIITEKGAHKDWTQREIALTSLQECFEMVSSKDLQLEQEFLTNCTVLLKQSLEENNIQIYLLAVQATAVFFTKALWYDTVLDALPTLLKAVIMRTADSNTRVRKKSVDLINQVWEANPPTTTSSLSGKRSGTQATKDSISGIIAEIITDAQLAEKCIVGRIGLLIKRALLIESAEDLGKRSHQVFFGRDYEQLTEFACQWSSHKATKVRQCALKLIVEMCRVNFIDPRGAPFKQRIINFILGLRPSLRDPLVIKINEVCMQSSMENADEADKKAAQEKPYINASELELSVATKSRATSLDARSAARNAAARQSQNKENAPAGDSGKLPSIGGVNLPAVSSLANAPQAPGQTPTIVLPHSEPLSEEKKQENDSYIQLFGLEIVTCFFSQSWSTRQAAIQKIAEQLHNLDPQRRDAMFGEINRQNLPVELTFKTFLNYCDEGLKDPVLKNYILILELIQRALPVFFRNVKPEMLKPSLLPLVSSILKKTSDLKQKIREASINFCLYLSHQSPIGPRIMVDQVLIELATVQKDEKSGVQISKADAQKTAATNYGNSHMIASCLKLLQQYQSQTKIITVQNKGDHLFSQFLKNINLALKHQNPQVRKEGEALFKLLYLDFGEGLVNELVDQKPAVMSKLTADSKAESIAKFQQEQASQSTSIKPASSQDKERQQKAADQFNIQRTTSMIRDDLANDPAVLQLLGGQKEILHQLRLPNMKKRIRAIVDIKKQIQQKISQVNTTTARDLFEPCSLLMRQLLTDDAAEVYLESLALLRYVVGSLAPHLSSLDLHLMMGSFIGLIVNNQASGNMRIRVASDKVIVYFAKHNSIGSYIVAKEVLKNIERINRTLMTQTATLHGDKAAELQEEQMQRKEILVRFYGILNLLLQQFSIVLCYQPDCFAKCLDLVAETMSFCQEEPLIKNACAQIIISLYQIDPKLLDAGVSKLEVSKKSHIRKVMIEFENQQAKTKGLQVSVGGSGPGGMLGGERLSSPNQSFRDTQQSFTSVSTNNNARDQDSALSPFERRQQTASREFGSSRHAGGAGATGEKWGGSAIRARERNSEVRTSNKQIPSGYSLQSLDRPMEELGAQTGSSWLANQKSRRDRENKASEFQLPEIDLTPGRKRSIQQGVTTGAPTKIGNAAGFKRGDVSDRTAGDRAAGLDKAFGQGITNQGGIGLGLGGSSTANTTEMGGTQYSGGYQPSIGAVAAQQRASQNSFAGGSPGSSRRRSIQRLAGGTGSHWDPSQSSAAMSSGAAGQGPNRPPLYNPTRREGDYNPVSSSITSTQMKSELSSGYVPSAMGGSGVGASRPGQPEPNILGQRKPSFGQDNSQERPRFGSNTRDPTAALGSVNTGSRFQMQPKQSMKPPMAAAGGTKLKSSAPPVATFEFKQNVAEYKDPSKSKQYKPDILM